MPSKTPKIATFIGHQIRHVHPTFSDRILRMFSQEPDWPELPSHTVSDWLHLQRDGSRNCRNATGCWWKASRNEGRDTTWCAYGFAGRNAQQTLGLLLTQRMEETGS